MLRRAVKRNNPASGNDPSTEKREKIKRVHTKQAVLGDRAKKDEAETALEELVIGVEEHLAEKLEESLSKTHHKKKKKKLKDSEKPRPVWEDEDDDNISVTVLKAKSGLQHQRVKEQVTGEKYKSTLQNQFEKVSGNPEWAKLSWEKESASEGEESDEDDLLQKTGSYLTKSESLPKGLIQMKRCADANKEAPSKGKLKSVEFHPTAQVMLTAGMNQTLSLFQVDGKHNLKIQSVFLERFPIHTAHFTTDGQEVILGSRHKNFYYYDMIAGKVVNVPHIKGLEENNMSQFQLSPDGRFITFLGKNGHIHLISAKSKEWLSTLKMNGSVESIAFTPDGSKMYSLGDDGEVYIWDMRTRDCIHHFIDEGCLHGTTISFSKNQQYLATGSYNGVVNVYDPSQVESTRSPRPLKAIMNLTSPCTHTLFNSTSEILAIASNYTERAVKMVHLPSFTVFSNFPDKVDNLRIPMCIDFSLNSGYFTMGNHRGEALLYRVKHYGNY